MRVCVARVGMLRAKTVCIYRTYSHLLVASSLEMEANRPVRVEGLAVPRRAPLHVVEVLELAREIQVARVLKVRGVIVPAAQPVLSKVSA